LDVEWEYPRTKTDKVDFVNLLNAPQLAFQLSGFLLSAAISAGDSTLNDGIQQGNETKIPF